MYIQPSLFEPSASLLAINDIIKVPGLTYHRNFINIAEEKHILCCVDNGLWLNDLKRRVQHFGYKYDYKARKIDADMWVGGLPNWLESLAVKLKNEGFFHDIPDQVIVNEYLQGQGITPHIDCEPCFAETVVSLSLNSTAVMEFSKAEKKIPLLLEPRSIIVLSDEARYEWKHSIPARKKDLIHGLVYPRKRRVSLTFRKVIV